jgi:hypothetical protein
MSRHCPMTSQEYIAKNSIPEPNSGCWLWTGSVNNWGYGRGRARGLRERGAHRISFRAHRGPISPGLLVLHRCDTPSCVNPDHLFLGTTSDNSKDMVAKGRQARIGGESHRGAKLTECAVRDIRAIAKSGRPYSVSELARQHGVSRRAIRFVITGASWKIDTWS